MRLDQAIVDRDLCESRTEAQECINKKLVLVNGEICIKQSKYIKDTDIIEIISKRKYVSRGGEKLEGVLLDVFGNEKMVSSFCTSKTALDIGSSTGGFTDCLLNYGVSEVDAVDVGTSQLHERVRSNKNVNVYENTDIRNFEPNKKYTIVVGDLSFIPLEIVLEKIIKFGRIGTNYFLLIKPQFEVGKGNTKKGVVKNGEFIKKILEKYKELAIQYGLTDIDIFPSKIKGGDGNQEYFLYGVFK